MAHVPAASVALGAALFWGLLVLYTGLLWVRWRSRRTEGRGR